MQIHQIEERSRIHRDKSREGIALATQGRWEEAVQANRALLAAFPDDVEAQNRLGKALSELGHYTEARSAFQRALEKSPSNPIARKNLERLADLSDAPWRQAPGAADPPAVHRRAGEELHHGPARPRSQEDPRPGRRRRHRVPQDRRRHHPGRHQGGRSFWGAWSRGLQPGSSGSSTAATATSQVSPPQPRARFRSCCGRPTSIPAWPTSFPSPPRPVSSSATPQSTKKTWTTKTKWTRLSFRSGPAQGRRGARSVEGPGPARPRPPWPKTRKTPTTPSRCRRRNCPSQDPEPASLSWAIRVSNLLHSAFRRNGETDAPHSTRRHCFDNRRATHPHLVIPAKAGIQGGGAAGWRELLHFHGRAPVHGELHKGHPSAGMPSTPHSPCQAKVRLVRQASSPHLSKAKKSGHGTGSMP